jgi:hypothetical protein
MQVKRHIRVELARHENLGCLELRPEVSRDNRWMHHRLRDVIVKLINRVKPVYSPNFATGRAGLFASSPSYP